MKREAEKLALLIKRGSTRKAGESLTVGKVIKLSPLTVSIDNEIILDEELIITYTIRQLITSSELSLGNRVAMLTTDGQRYLVIDKVVQ